VLASLYVTAIFPTGVQISVAVAVPVLAGSVEASQLIVKLKGQVITGAVISCTVIVWMHSLKFPVTSVALHVLVIT
jgi:hypothetical protein